jgi:hypothetical protein
VEVRHQRPTPVLRSLPATAGRPFCERGVPRQLGAYRAQFFLGVVRARLSLAQAIGAGGQFFS